VIKLDVQICLQCGSMKWLVWSKSYTAEFRVREDGHVEFDEDFGEVEYSCLECGSSSALLGVRGTPRRFRELVKLSQMERVLKTLEWAADGTLEVTDQVEPEDLLDMVECFKERWESAHGEGSADGFFSRAKEIIGRMKLLE